MGVVLSKSLPISQLTKPLIYFFTVSKGRWGDRKEDGREKAYPLTVKLVFVSVIPGHL